MSTELLTSALNALRSLAGKAETRLVEVRLIVEDRAGARRLASVLQPEAEQPSQAVGDVVSSMEAIQLWETGTELEEAQDLGGNVAGMLWRIDWQQRSGPTD
jgi:hypothetical protein